VTARARMQALRDARVRPRDLLGPDAGLRRLAARQLFEQIGGLAKSG